MFTIVVAASVAETHGCCPYCRRRLVTSRLNCFELKLTGTLRLADAPTRTRSGLTIYASRCPLGLLHHYLNLPPQLCRIYSIGITMFATVAPFDFQPNLCFHHPAPLSPLNPNVARHPPAHFRAKVMSFRSASSDGPPKAPARLSDKFARQARDPHKERDTRRRAFLNKVKERGADQKFEARQDQVSCTFTS